MNDLDQRVNIVETKHDDSAHHPTLIVGIGILGAIPAIILQILNLPLISINHTGTGPYPVMASSVLLMRDIVFVQVVLAIFCLEIGYGLFLSKRRTTHATHKLTRGRRWICGILLWALLYFSGMLIHNPAHLLSILYNPFQLIFTNVIYPFVALKEIYLGGKIILGFIWVNALFLGWELFWRLDVLRLRWKKFPSRGFFLSALVVSIVLSTVIHELGHFLFVIGFGGDVLRIIFYPTIYNGDFVFGLVQFCCVSTEARSWIMIGPIFTQFTYAALFALLMFTTKKRSELHNNKQATNVRRHIIRLFLQVNLILALVDIPMYALNNALGLPHWFLFGEPQGDYLVFSELTNIPLFVIGICGAITLCIGVCGYQFIIKKLKDDFL